MLHKLNVGLNFLMQHLVYFIQHFFITAIKQRKTRIG